MDFTPPAYKSNSKIRKNKKKKNFKLKKGSRVLISCEEKVF